MVRARVAAVLAKHRRDKRAHREEPAKQVSPSGPPPPPSIPPVPQGMKPPPPPSQITRKVTGPKKDTGKKCVNGVVEWVTKGTVPFKKDGQTPVYTFKAGVEKHWNNFVDNLERWFKPCFLKEQDPCIARIPRPDLGDKAEFIVSWGQKEKGGEVQLNVDVPLSAVNKFGLGPSQVH